jgi:probable phosphoglycerate mutase
LLRQAHTLIHSFRKGGIVLYQEILILRHGETEWNQSHRHQGQLDSPLTPKGRAQAQAMNGLIQPILAERPELEIFSSPLGRCQQTAQILLEGTGRSARSDPRLKEVHFGAWQGLFRSDIRAGWPGVDEMIEREGFLWNFHSPGGETYDDLRARAQSFLDDLTAPALIVTHGVLSRVMRALWLGLNEYDLDSLPGGQGVIFHLDPEAGHSTLAP